jgi:hypothetical protein
MDTIINGYTMPLAQWPPESRLENNTSAKTHMDKVEEFLYMYEAGGCIVATEETPHLVLPLSLVFSNKWRLVIDGSRNLNPYLRKRPVKLSHLESANQCLKPGSWFATCDLESGYHQVLVKPAQRCLLGTMDQEWKEAILAVEDPFFRGPGCSLYLQQITPRPHSILQQTRILGRYVHRCNESGRKNGIRLRKVFRIGNELSHSSRM